MLDIIKKFLTLGAVEQQNTPNGTTSRITNQVLLDELVEHFEHQMKELSARNRLLYPMSFNILMHPTDYTTTKDSLPFVLPEVVAAFYDVIKRHKVKNGKEMNYAPAAKYWYFQFSACQINVKTGMKDFIKQGEIVTTANLTTFDIKNIRQGNIRSEANIRLSVKCQNSNTNDNNINMDALLGLNILSEGVYTFDYDKTLNEDTRVIEAASNLKSSGIAQLRWMADNGQYLVYDMMDSYIDISGPADTRDTRNICHVENDAVGVSHVQIKYDQASQMFHLAAYAKTRLNTHEVPISSGGNPIWVILPRTNSKIFINDAVSIEFNAK